MIRVSTFALCATLIAAPAFAEGPQERALDQSLAQMEGTAAPVDNTTATIKHTAKTHHKAKVTKTKPATTEGPDEQRLDQGVQPQGSSDPSGDAEVRRLNGGN